ncbi:hypothetical protein PIB30_013484 [Stylosanthes scabra]|uniref:ADP-ribosyl cyclase/cyclic ADP-ribose hydrolase n=1 Tax=Stylosanthes scabra TaxID=79078 RepID=A0ABU6Z880_9FABA|nr:hypothetical protein [Stylosanthes scabra]
MLSSPCSTEYDVFISFRGEDTRKNFTVHLFNTLKDSTIQTYMDCLLERGEEVWPALEKAIERSLMSIVVFSENYATSKWCLEELVKITQWKEDHGQVVIPVFYRTDPTDVRKQTGSYEKAFAKHERDFAESESNVITKWRDSLRKSANISGWHSEYFPDDYELIKAVVNDVLKMRILKQPLVPTDLVGMEEIYESMKFHVEYHQVIGIWGMVGIGKRTIAKMLFAKYFPNYDHVCYVENAKEYTPKRLISELLRKEIPIDVTGFKTSMISLCKTRVLIVLNDVTNSDQSLIEAVCEVYKSYYSRASKLVITSTYKHLLIGRVDHIYDVQPLEKSKAVELLSLKAFGKRVPEESFAKLVKKVVEYAGGNPLALNLLGSDLRTKKEDFWLSTLEKKRSNQVIYNAFRNIYDELEELEKDIFRDIAFFFHGEKKDLVTSILEACDFSPIRGIEVLQDKAVITTIPYKETIEMHSLLRKIAFDIVGTENRKDPRKRSRLKDVEDIRDVLEESKETLDTEGIILDLSLIKEDLRLSPDAFKRMKKLRFLKFYIPSGQSSGKMIHPTDLEPFSGKLRYFECHQYPFKSLPQRFCAKLLVEIRMPHSQVKKLWEEKQELDNLEGIDLSECKELEELPDLSEAKRLRWVNLSGCESLAVLHSSVFSSDTLVSLILDRCTDLQCVKAERHLHYLQHLSVKGCSNLREFAVSSELIKNLDLSNTKVEKLDKSIGKLQKLECLNLEGSRVKHLPKELSELKLLKELKHSYSGLVIDKQQLQDLFNGLHSLQTLHLKDCRNSFEFPENINALSKLRELRLDGSNVTRLPSTIKHLQELEILYLNNCSSLETLPELPPSVKEFSADNCFSLESVSDLSTLATKMVGKTKRISFNNSLKLSAGHTLHSIMESIHSTMMSAVSSNVTVRSYATDVHSYNYNSVEVCLPGGTIPEQFAYKTDKSSSITIELPDSPSNFLGFIYSVVLSPRHGMKKHGAKFQCEYNFAGGKNSSWEDITISELNSDHVYIWYDPFLTDKILGQDKPSFHLEFSVATDTGEVDDSIHIKECGVQIINESEWQRFSLELDKKKKDMEEESSEQQLHPPHGSQDHNHVQIPPQDLKKERFDEKQSNDMENHTSKQQREMSEQSSSDSKIDHFLDAEEKMESPPSENKTSGRKSSHGENKIKGKGNEETPTESETGLPLSIDSVKSNGMEEVKHLEEKQKEKERMDLETSECEDRSSNAEQTENIGQQDLDAKKRQFPIHSSIPSHGVKVARKLTIKELGRYKKAKVEGNPARATQAKVQDIHLSHLQAQNTCTSIAQVHGNITIPSLDDPQVALELLKHFDASTKRLQITEFVDNHVVYPYDHSITKDLDVSALCRWLQVQGLRSVSVARFAEMKFLAAKREREEELRLAKEENAKVKEALKTMKERVSRVEWLEKRVGDLKCEVACWRSKYEESEKKVEDESKLDMEMAAELVISSFENCRSQVSTLYPEIDLSRVGAFKEIRNGQIVSPSDSEDTECEQVFSNFKDAGRGAVSSKLLIWFRRFKFCQCFAWIFPESKK